MNIAYVLRLCLRALLNLIEVLRDFVLQTLNITDCALPTSDLVLLRIHFSAQLIVINASSEVLVHSVQFGQLLLQILHLDLNKIQLAGRLIPVRNARSRPTFRNKRHFLHSTGGRGRICLVGLSRSDIAETHWVAGR